MGHAERHPVRRAFLTFVLFALAVAYGGCFASPQPDPPSLVPDKVFQRGADRGGTYIVVGEAGSVEAGEGARVFMALLDRPASPIVSTEVAADGSFSFLGVMLDEGDELRLWVEDGDTRSASVDLRVRAMALVVALRPLACVSATPADTLELEAAPGTDAVGTLVLTNGCGEPIAIESAQLRAPAEGLSIGAVPTTVDPSASLEITFRASGAEVEEILLVTLVGAERERRPITLRGVVTD